MPTTRRSTKRAAAADAKTAVQISGENRPSLETVESELDMLAAVAVRLENEQAASEKRKKPPATKPKPKKASGRSRVKKEPITEEYDDEEDDDIFEEFPGTNISISVPPKPKNLEMTQTLLDSLMFPIKVRPSFSSDEVFLTIPLDQSDQPDCYKVCFTGHNTVKVSGFDEEYQLKSFNGYVELKDRPISDNQNLQPTQQFQCNESFQNINSELRLQKWVENIAFGNYLSTVGPREHDYVQNFMKFGQPESTTLLETAIAAFNKFKNFIALSGPVCNESTYLFGLWWEKEDPTVDFWLLPKPVDKAENDYFGLPENHWSGSVVVGREELIADDDPIGQLVPFADLLDTPANMPRQEQHISWEDTKKSMHLDEQEKSVQQIKPKLQPTLDNPVTLQVTKKGVRQIVGGPSQQKLAFVPEEDEFDEDDLDDESFDAFGVNRPLPKKRSVAASHPVKGKKDSNPMRMQNSAAAGGGGETEVKRKSLSREKVEEMDFAMRCIKEIQHHRYRGYYPLRCKICHREFTAPTSLIVHYRSHAGIKPFTCSICLASFTRRHSLKYHMLCHSGEARFRCGICARLFRHSGHFRDHLRKHELGTPFGCELCGTEFGTRTSYRRHMLVAHQTTPAKIDKRHLASSAHNVIIDEESYSIGNTVGSSPSKHKNSNVIIEELVTEEMDDDESLNVVPGLLVIPRGGSTSSQTLVVQRSREPEAWAFVQPSSSGVSLSRLTKPRTQTQVTSSVKPKYTKYIVTTTTSPRESYHKKA